MTMCQSFHPRVLLKFGVGSLVPSLFLDEKDARKYSDPIKFAFNLVRELGYMHMQATKPDTIGMNGCNCCFVFCSFTKKSIQFIFQVWRCPNLQLGMLLTF